MRSQVTHDWPKTFVRNLASLKKKKPASFATIVRVVDRLARPENYPPPSPRVKALVNAVVAPLLAVATGRGKGR